MSNTEPKTAKPENRDPAQELRAIGERRKALQEVVKITLFIARLHKALHAVLLMGQPASQIPKHVLQSYEKLSYQTQIRSNADLINDLAELDKRAEKSLHTVVQFATDDHLLGDHGEPVAMDAVFQQLGAFKRTVQTAVAIRLLLRERGHKAAPLTLPVPLEEIQGHISGLKAREQAKRDKMMSGIRAMIHDVEDIQRQGDFNEDFRAALDGVRKDLELNLAHLKAGRDIEHMPMTVEWVEMGEGGEDPIAKLSAEADTPWQAAPETAGQRPGKAGFLRRLKLWLFSPMSVTWKDTARHLEGENKPRK